MTMFACRISTPRADHPFIPATIDTFSSSDSTTPGMIMADVFISAFPGLLKVPNPLTIEAKNLRLELTRNHRDLIRAQHNMMTFGDGYEQVIIIEKEGASSVSCSQTSYLSLS
jgi:hypothetical protein